MFEIVVVRYAAYQLAVVRDVAKLVAAELLLSKMI